VKFTAGTGRLCIKKNRFMSLLGVKNTENVTRKVGLFISHFTHFRL
jgi:hypothetical protein